MKLVGIWPSPWSPTSRQRRNAHSFGCLPGLTVAQVSQSESIHAAKRCQASISSGQFLMTLLKHAKTETQKLRCKHQRCRLQLSRPGPSPSAWWVMMHKIQFNGWRMTISRIHELCRLSFHRTWKRSRSRYIVAPGKPMTGVKKKLHCAKTAVWPGERLEFPFSTRSLKSETSPKIIPSKFHFSFEACLFWVWSNLSKEIWKFTCTPELRILKFIKKISNTTITTTIAKNHTITTTTTPTTTIRTTTIRTTTITATTMFNHHCHNHQCHHYHSHHYHKHHCHNNDYHNNDYHNHRYHNHHYHSRRYHNHHHHSHHYVQPPLSQPSLSQPPLQLEYCVRTHRIRIRRVRIQCGLHIFSYTKHTYSALRIWGTLGWDCQILKLLFIRQVLWVLWDGKWKVAIPLCGWIVEWPLMALWDDNLSIICKPQFVQPKSTSLQNTMRSQARWAQNTKPG